MLKTEMRNPKSMNIDKMDTISMVQLINAENYVAVKAVEEQSQVIAQVIDVVADAFKKGGRLFYIGAGTSGRIGIMDAAECPPTFGVSKDKVIGIIAGGDPCLKAASENVEDNAELGREDLAVYRINEKDVVIGISVAGGAKYVLSALEYAKENGATTVGLTSNKGSLLSKLADYAICPDTGAEVITGSTRLKAGTAQKLILNTISTCAMVKSGYVYENLMINLRPFNEKLTERMINIVCEITKWDRAKAEARLEIAGWNIREAIKDE